MVIQSFIDSIIFVENVREYATPHPTETGKYILKFLVTNEGSMVRTTTKYVVSINEEDEWFLDGEKIANPVQFVNQNRKWLNKSLK